MVSGISSAYSEIRQNKKMLFGLLGFISGFLGALVADIIRIGESTTGEFFYLIFVIAVWAAIFSMFIATGLFYAIDLYGRRKTNWPELLKKSIPSGLIAGAVSGGIAQAVYGPISHLLSDIFLGILFQSACWGICGLILGLILSKSIPNLGARRAIYAGFIGGFLGGVGFQLVGLLMPETLGRMVGIGIMGAALGLCLVLVEERSRVAYVEVHWAPDEVSFFTLGNTPVFIGAGDSDICVTSVVRHAMSLVTDGGQIIATDHTKGKKKQLLDGDHINIGKIDMVIRTGIEKMKNN